MTDEQEPDYRFTLANERTYLAYLRTSLACYAGGLSAVQFLDLGPDSLAGPDHRCGSGHCRNRHHRGRLPPLAAEPDRDARRRQRSR